MRPPAFLSRALCQGADQRLFFPESERRRNYRQAIQWCIICPVAAACLQYALDTGSDYGMYGGATPIEREHMRQGKIDPAKYEPGHGDKKGTPAGFQREKRAGVMPCYDCRIAYSEDVTRRAKARGEQAS